MKAFSGAALLVLLACMPATAQQTGASPSCTGAALRDVAGLQNGKALEDGGVLGFGKMNINIDGYARAYHPRNALAGALIHLCNAGEVVRPDGRSYHGSESNSTCTGRFMQDVERIGAASWTNSSVGVVRWYGILGRGQAVVAGLTVRNVTPVLQADNSGFYVSPTTFADTRVADETDQRRYVHPLRVPAAVIPGSTAMSRRGVVMGSFGVALDSAKRIAVPFVVGDAGPRVGEGTPALARLLAGLPVTDEVTRQNRFAGQVDAARVLWVFFGSVVPRGHYDHANEQTIVQQSREAFDQWGGRARLDACLR